MKSNQRWLGWIAISLGALALLVSLAGRGFGQQVMAAAQGANGPQAYAQQAPAQQQSGQMAPGMKGQRGQQQAQPQGGQAAPSTNGQAGDQRQARPQGGQMAPGMNGQQGGGRPGEGRGARGGWFGSLFHGLGSFSNLGMVALLAVAGVWLLRRRSANGAPAAPAAQAEPQQPTGESPTGESYDVE